MRSKIPCTACGANSCLSGFVFKSSVSKCVCKSCYNQQKRLESVTANLEDSSKTAQENFEEIGHVDDAPEASSAAENLEEPAPEPVVIHLEGMCIS